MAGRFYTWIRSPQNAEVLKMPGPAEVEVNTNKRKESKSKTTTDPDIDHQHLILQMTMCFLLLHHLQEARRIHVSKNNTHCVPGIMLLPREELRQREERKGVNGEKKENPSLLERMET
ncbi:uncharacterized protein AAG666_004011 [Megaptera novaeangliae]